MTLLDKYGELQLTDQELFAADTSIWRIPHGHVAVDLTCDDRGCFITTRRGRQRFVFRVEDGEVVHVGENLP